MKRPLRSAPPPTRLGGLLESGGSPPSGTVARRVAGALLGTSVLVVIHLIMRDTFWNPEEGVYALTARLWLHGHEPYRQTAAAQPPPVFIVGAALLWVHDGLEWLRLGVGLFQLGAGLIAGELVWRTTRSTVGSVLAPAAVLLTPWAVQGNGMLTPEMVSLPFRLGALLASRRERTTALAGVLCGLLGLVKVPYLLPAVVIVASSVNPRRAGLWGLATFALGLAGCFALGGEAFYRDVVIAQTQTGLHSLGELKGWWLQDAWNLIGPVLCCAIAFGMRDGAADPGQLRACLLTAAAMLVTILSTFKNGTGLNVTVPVEAALVPGAISGIVLVVRAAVTGAGHGRWLAGAALACAAFTLAQSGSLLGSPTDPEPFLRADSSQVGWAVGLTGPQFAAAVDAARACPPGSVYRGQPLIAFAADRNVPDDQPDGFIIHARILHAVLHRALTAGPACG